MPNEGVTILNENYLIILLIQWQIWVFFRELQRKFCQKV